MGNKINVPEGEGECYVPIEHGQNLHFEGFFSQRKFHHGTVTFEGGFNPLRIRGSFEPFLISRDSELVGRMLSAFRCGSIDFPLDIASSRVVHWTDHNFRNGVPDGPFQWKKKEVELFGTVELVADKAILTGRVITNSWIFEGETELTAKIEPLPQIKLDYSLLHGKFTLFGEGVSFEGTFRGNQISTGTKETNRDPYVVIEEGVFLRGELLGGKRWTYRHGKEFSVSDV